jgi:hypothetical protein
MLVFVLSGARWNDGVLSLSLSIGAGFVCACAGDAQEPPLWKFLIKLALRESVRERERERERE